MFPYSSRGKIEKYPHLQIIFIQTTSPISTMNIDFTTNYILYVTVTNENKQIDKCYTTCVPRDSTFRKMFELIAETTDIPENIIMSRDSATGLIDTFDYDQLLQNIYGNCKTLSIKIEDVRETPVQVLKHPQYTRNTRKQKELAKKELVT